MRSTCTYVCLHVLSTLLCLSIATECSTKLMTTYAPTVSRVWSCSTPGVGVGVAKHHYSGVKHHQLYNEQHHLFMEWNVGCPMLLLACLTGFYCSKTVSLYTETFFFSLDMTTTAAAASVSPCFLININLCVCLHIFV